MPQSGHGDGVYQQSVVNGVSGIKTTVFPFSMKKHAVLGFWKASSR